jgi:hypothetical protein
MAIEQSDLGRHPQPELAMGMDWVYFHQQDLDKAEA